MSTGISLGWNCRAAALGVDMGLRKNKVEGYKTCPFDIMVSNYCGMIQCLNDDFKYFTDPSYLHIVDTPITEKYNAGEKIIHNTKYNFIFNHESPDHGKLYTTENWPEGKNHYVNNNFKNFIDRYNKRIQNFREYLSSGQSITFIINYPQRDYTKLIECIKKNYPSLIYYIVNVFNKEHDPSELFFNFHKIMGYNDNDPEIIYANHTYSYINI